MDFFQEWNTEIIDVFRLMLSCICGFVIGYERQERIRQKHIRSAGLRTHMLVALACAAMMLISKYGFMDVLWYDDNVRVDVSRVAAGIVSGVGFIGAGIIFMRRENIMGLTTASGLWATAAVGMAIGAGMYVCGIAVTVLILLIQNLDHMRLYQHVENQIALVEWEEKPGMSEELLAWLKANKIKVNNIRIQRLDRDQLQMRLDIDINKETGTALFAKLQEQFSNIIRIDF